MPQSHFVFRSRGFGDVVVTALVVWSHLCESCDGFSTSVFQQSVETMKLVKRRLV